MNGCVTLKNNPNSKVQNQFIRGNHIIDNPTPRFEFIKEFIFNGDKRVIRYDSQSISWKDENTFDVWVSEELTTSKRFSYTLKRYRFNLENYSYFIIATVDLNDYGEMSSHNFHYPTNYDDYKSIIPTSIEESIYLTIKSKF